MEPETALQLVKGLRKEITKLSELSMRQAFVIDEVVSYVIKL